MINYSVHVGPFIKAKSSTVFKRQKVPGCKKCKKEMSSSFCPKCGSKKDLIEKIEVEPAVDIFGVSKEIEETLITFEDPCDKNTDLWVSNLKDQGGISFSPMWETPAIIYVAEDIKKEIEMFKKDFKKEIAILKNKYDEIQIHWGILNHIQ